MTRTLEAAAPAGSPLTTAENLTAEQISFYRANGFVRVAGIISPPEAAQFHNAALRYARDYAPPSTSAIFDQMVNVWQSDEAMKALTLHPNVAAIAQKLAGVPLRLWHDQLLIKKPHNNAATEYHQDQPYWPHRDSVNPISCWIALCDVPVEKGCMTFIRASHRRTDLPPQNLSSATSLFELCPDLQWDERVTVPLRAGDCTFHHGRCAHMATPNFTDDPRVAHVMIFMDAVTRYEVRPHPHIITDSLGLCEGQLLDDEMFPLAENFK